MVNNIPYRRPLPGASIPIVPLSQSCLVSFYSVWIFFFFFFTIMFSSSKLQYSKFFFLLSMREQKFVSTLNPVKNVAIQISGRGPNCTAQTLSLWTIAFSECEREYPYLHIYQKGIVTFDFVLGHKSLEISLKFSQPRFLTAKQKKQINDCRYMKIIYVNCGLTK